MQILGIKVISKLPSRPLWPPGHCGHLAKTWPKLAKIGQNRPKSAKIGQNWPKSAKKRPSAQNLQILELLGNYLAKQVVTLPNRPKLVTKLAKCGQNWPKIGQNLKHFKIQFSLSFSAI